MAEAVIVSAIFRLKRDTAANWTANNPVLKLGEPGYETDTLRLKFGDGSTAWTALDYSGDLGVVLGTIAALVPATGDMVYFTSPTTAAATPSSAFGRAWLNRADVAAALTALGISDHTARIADLETRMNGQDVRNDNQDATINSILARLDALEAP